MTKLSIKQKIKNKKQIGYNRVFTKVGLLIAVGKQRILNTPTQLERLIKYISAWIRSRPAAVQYWVAEDRKKKKYRSFRLQKKLKPEPRYIPTSWTLFKSSVHFLSRNARPLSGLLFLQAVLYFLLLRQPAELDLTTIQDTIRNVAQTSPTSGSGVVATLGTVLSSNPNSSINPTAATAFIVFFSLFYIWIIRRLHTRLKVKTRDAIYNGPAPIITVTMLLFVMSLQLLPFVVSVFFYVLARTGGFFSTGLEDMTGFFVTAATGLLSFYWLTSTIIALYIASLQGMYPLQALRTAKKLVQAQRFMIFRRILGLMLIAAISYLSILLLVIRFSSAQTYLVMDALQLLFLPLIHVYLYKLYRALI